MNTPSSTTSGAMPIPHGVNTPVLALRTITSQEAFAWLADAREEIKAVNKFSGEHSRNFAMGEHPHDATARLLREPAARA